MTVEEIIRQIVNHYPKEIIVIQAHEELGELIQAISKRYRTDNSSTAYDLCEEIADVEIMIAEIKLLYNVDADMVSALKATKLWKMKNLMEDK